ncbi:MAG: patatin-like phospholipase family protein [Pseudomonadota bacterium]|nr:patatin-like phospholipase family protein [Pseudomonadota bacterium]
MDNLDQSEDSASLEERLTSSAPKRILSLDGGGIRGALTLGYLERFEAILRTRFSNPGLKLCEYFDLIGGTSTGAIIASGLAIGMDASTIKRFYLDIGERVFAKRKLLKWEAWYDAEPLKQALESVFGDRTLGDPSIRTGLCIVTKRADTGSLWPLFNHPRGKFYEANKDFLLREVVRASTAVPTLFQPEEIEVSPGISGVFVDGGVSLAKNPSLQLFLIATLSGYNFNWPIGEDRLLLVSLGTGAWRHAHSSVHRAKVWDWAKEVPSLLIEDADWQNQLLLHYLSRSPTPREFDIEVGDLSSDMLTPEPALTYLRYDTWLEPESFDAMGLPELASEAISLRTMTDASIRYDLARIGERAAKLQVREEHFPAAFDSPLYPC